MGYVLRGGEGAKGFGGAPYDAGATEAQRTVGVSHRAADEEDAFQEDDAPVEGRRATVVVNVRFEATAAAGEAGWYRRRSARYGGSRLRVR